MMQLGNAYAKGSKCVSRTYSEQDCDVYLGRYVVYEANLVKDME
jgi:hypothetical protein